MEEWLGLVKKGEKYEMDGVLQGLLCLSKTGEVDAFAVATC